ncbi:MAG: YncE family protein [Leadbetterella sp.]
MSFSTLKIFHKKLKSTGVLILGFNFCFSQSIEFNSRGLLFLRDTDFGAFTLKTGNIDKQGNEPDKIGALEFPLSLENSSQYSEQTISNSFVNNHSCLAINSNKKLAYVLESKKQLRSDKNSTFKTSDLGSGGYISVVDISDMRNLKAVYRFQVGVNPTSIALSPNSDFLAVTSQEFNQELQIFELDPQGKPAKLIPKANLMSTNGVTDIVWHPMGDYLTYISSPNKEVGLLKIVKDNAGKIIRLDIHGPPIRFEGLPVKGLYSIDAKYFFVMDIKLNPEKNTSNSKGNVFCIRFNFDTPTEHALLSKAETDPNPMNMIAHPAGRYILVVNNMQSFEYPISEKISNNSSVSILTISNDGNLNNKNNVNIKGLMPSGVAFDQQGQNIALSTFQYFSFGKPIGGIEFYKFNSGNNPSIEKQNARINVGSGIHMIRSVY